MRQKDEHSKPQQGNNKFPDKIENGFNFFGMVFPEPTFEPVGEGTTATIILTNTHELQPLAFS